MINKPLRLKLAEGAYHPTAQCKPPQLRSAAGAYLPTAKYKTTDHQYRNVPVIDPNVFAPFFLIPVIVKV